MGMIALIITFLSDKYLDRFPGSAPVVAVAQMGPLVVVVVELGIEIGLQGLDALIELLAHLRHEKFLQHGAVEALDETVGLR